jgi:hypothetical protein
MAKTRPAAAGDLLPAERPLIEVLLLAALGRNGNPLRPYPTGVRADDLAAALEDLRRQGHVHGQSFEPTLTLDGRDAARALEAAGAKERTAA